MTTITTNAFAYRDAVEDQSRYQNDVTLAEIKSFCDADPEDETCPPLDAYNSHCSQLDLEPFYNQQVVDATMAQLDLEDCERTQKILSRLVYNTRSHNRALATIKKYEDMIADGWTPIHDITPDMHGKKAHMVGESSGIMGTSKIDMKVTIVCDGEYRGYKKPRQRTRYYVPAHDAQTFIKLI